MHQRVSEQLELAGIPYRVHHHKDFPSPIKSADDFASALGYPLSRITKSLFVRSNKADDFAVVVCSVDSRVDFRSVATAFGWKRAQVASREELEGVVGYLPTGVSPIGLPGSIKLILDSNLNEYSTVLIGGGVPGVEVEIAPADLATLVGAKVIPITESA